MGWWDICSTGTQVWMGVAVEVPVVVEECGVEIRLGAC